MHKKQGIRTSTLLTHPSPISHTESARKMGMWGQITYLTELALRTESSAAYEALTARIERIMFLSSNCEQKENCH